MGIISLPHYKGFCRGVFLVNHLASADKEGRQGKLLLPVFKDMHHRLLLITTFLVNPPQAQPAPLTDHLATISICRLPLSAITSVILLKRTLTRFFSKATLQFWNAGVKSFQAVMTGSPIASKHYTLSFRFNGHISR